MRNEWVRPELTVLVRSLPEEAVLVACKYKVKDGDIAGPGTKNCTVKDNPDCSALAPS